MSRSAIAVTWRILRDTGLLVALVAVAIEAICTLIILHCLP